MQVRHVLSFTFHIKVVPHMIWSI